MKKLFISTLLLLTCLVPFPVLAQELSRIEVTAGFMRTLADGTVLAGDGVVVTGEGVVVHADSMRYDPGSDALRLSGNVVMEETGGGGSFTGDALTLSLSDLTGGISRGEIIIVPNGFRVKGEDISRIGPEEYSIRKGVFTSCPGECPDWSFTASRIRVRKEGYLEARHAAFRILDVPVFYTPYLLYPVKTDRQTGILFPEFSFTEETGFESAWPVFVTLGPHADVTLTPRTFSRDATGLDLQARYLLDYNGGGGLDGFTMGGSGDDRWYVSARHAGALAQGVWLRARWYDAGTPGAPLLFGDEFTERYPGTVSRHATLEGEKGPFGFLFQTGSLLLDASQSRSDLDSLSLDRDTAALFLGPVNVGPLRVGVDARRTSFDSGEERSLVEPQATLRFTGPGRLGAVVRARALLSGEAEGTIRDRSTILEATGRLAMVAAGEWGKSRIGIDLTVASAQEAAFSGSARDGEDVVEKRNLVAGKVTHRLSAGIIEWDLTAGAWEDREMEISRVYGSTALSGGGFFVEGARNPDARYGLVLPSMDLEAAAVKGWETRAGYRSEPFGLEAGRISAVGFPESLVAEGHFVVGGVRFGGQSQYDLDAEAMADETLTIHIPGRCWSVGLGRSRSPGRTDWTMKLGLEI